MYKIIIVNWENDPELDVINRNEWDSFRYIFGEKTEKKILVKFKSHSNESLCDILLFNNYMIVSERLRSILIKYKNVESEFIPVQIVHKSKIFIYYIFNVITQLDCVDYEKSDVDIEYGEITLVRKLIIKESETKGLPYFLISKSADQLICFNTNLIEELNSSGATGFKFMKIEKYSFLYMLK